MKTLNIIPALVLALLPACSAGIQPSLDLGPDPMTDGGVMGDAGASCPPTVEECAPIPLCLFACHYDDAGALVDGGGGEDAGADAGEDAGADAGDPPDMATSCGSIADGCMGQFPFPATDDTTVTAAGSPYFGAVGDYRESVPQVLPAVLVARQLDITTLRVSVAGGASPCGPPPEFRVLVNGIEVGRTTPPGFGEYSMHFDFAPIAGTVFVIRYEEVSPWCASTLRITPGSSVEALAILRAP